MSQMLEQCLANKPACYYSAFGVKHMLSGTLIKLWTVYFWLFKIWYTYSMYLFCKIDAVGMSNEFLHLHQDS